jgi:hypothetical protein
MNESRSRRVKCDEIKPHCLRCFQSRIGCSGYKAKGTQPHGPKGSFPDEVTILAGSSHEAEHPVLFKAYLDPALLSHIGLNSLLNFEGAFSPTGQKAWKHLLARYANASQGAQAACIVYGAVKELQVCAPNLSSPLEDIYHQYYGSAVSLLRNDVKNVDTRLPSVFVTCLLLCSIELLFRRRQNALQHVKALFRITYTACHFFSSTTAEGSPDPDAMELQPEIASDFHQLLHLVDIQILSYSNGTRLASMDVCPPSTLEKYIMTQGVDSSTDEFIIHVIHAAHAFFAKATQDVGAGTPTDELIKCQNRLLDLLQHGTSLLNCTLLDGTKHSQNSSWKTMRNCCLALSALLTNLFCPFEAGWALESVKFESIITSAEELLASKNMEMQSSCGRQEVKFVPQLGIIPPLYLAAVKYRNSTWRRRAISCLRRAGLEGPWNGAMSAALAERCMEIEESTPDKIPSEKSMVSLCWAMDDNGENDGRLWPSSAYGSTVMKVIRRVQPAIIADAILLSSAHYNKDSTAKNVRNLDPQVWESWQERIDFGPVEYKSGRQ